ncbi:hypothetical protein [Thermogymnomonas acidicola]|uniref:hypothetical protein n=1 Tax=Thermogymnomonas acidicola TaxID=399579 RepID=UPI001396A563|nr:hypothetical protein [Thermogymnomonas acidicola]
MKAAMEYALEVVTRDGKVLVERKVEGEEFSLQGFCDGSRIHFMPVVQDYKRAYEGDRGGPNTGGMGSISDRDHGLPLHLRLCGKGEVHNEECCEGHGAGGKAIQRHHVRAVHGDLRRPGADRGERQVR